MIEVTPFSHQSPEKQQRPELESNTRAVLTRKYKLDDG